MARIRTIKPDFFASLTVASLSIQARLTFIGLWTHVDDEGRAVDDARLVKAAVWPLDDRLPSEVEEDLKELSEASLIVRYEVRGRRYLVVVGWLEHQRINRPTLSRLPSPDAADRPDPPPTNRRSDQDSAPPDANPRIERPPLHEPSVNGHGSLTAGSGSGNGKDHHPRGRTTLTRPARVVVEHLGCDDDDGQWIADEVHRRHRPNNLAAYIRRMAAAGDLAPLLAERHQAATGPPLPVVDPPCGDCGPNRQIDLDGRVARCPNCHPLRAGAA